MTMLEKAKKLARYTEELAAGPDWGVDDQDTLEWLIGQAEKLETSSQQPVEADAEYVCDCGNKHTAKSPCPYCMKS